LSKDQILHAGQSLYHDIAPANAGNSERLGEPAVDQTWIRSGTSRNC
jgi:hypothetical protein